MTLPIEPFPVEDIEAEYDAWVARCLVSHAGHFAPLRNTSVAFHPPTKPLSELRVALGTSAGVHLHTMAPFDMASHAGDDSIRWIPGDAPTALLHFSHDHYDHTDADEDPNCIFPLDRLRELAADKVIASAAAHHIGFMGWIPDPNRFLNETVPQVVAELVRDKVDAVVFSPG
jgi:D-proline reductase (dithiol) PrdB